MNFHKPSVSQFAYVALKSSLLGAPTLTDPDYVYPLVIDHVCLIVKIFFLLSSYWRWPPELDWGMWRCCQPLAMFTNHFRTDGKSACWKQALSIYATVLYPSSKSCDFFFNIGFALIINWSLMSYMSMYLYYTLNLWICKFFIQILCLPKPAALWW